MAKFILSEYEEKQQPILKASLKRMSEHPYSSEQWDEQFRRNQEIRRQNEAQLNSTKKTQEKDKGKSE